MSIHQITIPNVKLELDDLFALVRQLDAEARRRLAEVLVESEMDGRLGDLIRRLASKPASTEISDVDIDLEVKAVRAQRVA